MRIDIDIYTLIHIDVYTSKPHTVCIYIHISLSILIDALVASFTSMLSPVPLIMLSLTRRRILAERKPFVTM